MLKQSIGLRNPRLTASLLAPLFLLCVAATASAQQSSLPATGRVDNYAGVALWGQCVPNARALGVRLTGRTLPFLGKYGVAADFWSVNTPGFAKAGNGSNLFPRPNSFIIYSRQLGGTGHIAMVIGTVDFGARRVVRVVDCNWAYDNRGQIHDVSLNDTRILGWLVPQ